MGIIKIALVDEHGHEKVEVDGDTHVLDSILPNYQSDHYQCLPFIDQYGDTVFNRLQMKRLILEWDALGEVAADVPTRTVVQQVRDLIRKGSSDPHLYLKFFGD